MYVYVHIYIYMYIYTYTYLHVLQQKSLLREAIAMKEGSKGGRGQSTHLG
jgi:hypothetical protein